MRQRKPFFVVKYISVFLYFFDTIFMRLVTDMLLPTYGLWKGAMAFSDNRYKIKPYNSPLALKKVKLFVLVRGISISNESRLSFSTEQFKSTSRNGSICAISVKGGRLLDKRGRLKAVSTNFNLMVAFLASMIIPSIYYLWFCRV